MKKPKDAFTRFNFSSFSYVISTLTPDELRSLMILVMGVYLYLISVMCQISLLSGLQG
jgi:hypothetical protein